MGCELYVLPLCSGTGGLSKMRKEEVVPAGVVVEANVVPGVKVKTDKMSIIDMYNSMANHIETLKQNESLSRKVTPRAEKMKIVLPTLRDLHFNIDIHVALSWGTIRCASDMQ